MWRRRAGPIIAAVSAEPDSISLPVAEPAVVRSVAVEMTGVVKDFGPVRALDGVDLVIPAGAITAILGPSGAGKTVTVKHMVGLLLPTRGTVRVMGNDVSSLSEAGLRDLRQKMAVMLQGGLFGSALFESRTVTDNVAFGLRTRAQLSAQEIDTVAADYVRRVGLEAAAHQLPEELSGGMRKRAALARALALESPLVIIDDFESGVDGVRVALLCQLIREVQQRTGSTMIVTTHHVESAETISDYAAVIHDGRVLTSGPTAEVIDSDDPATNQLMRGERTGPITLYNEVGPERKAEYMKLNSKRYGMGGITMAAVGFLSLIIVLLYWLSTKDLSVGPR